MVIGIAVLATNLVAGAWGAWAWIRQRPSVAFWYLLRVAQATVVLQVIAGTILLLLRPRGAGRPALPLRRAAAAGHPARGGRARPAPPSAS